MIQVAARRYADAIHQIALKDGTVETWSKDLARLAESMADKNVARAMSDPRFPAQAKLAYFESLLPEMSANLRNLLRLLLHRRRIELLPDISTALQELVARRAGIARAEVITAVPIEKSVLDIIARRIADYIGKRVDVEARVDASIIGGVVARIGDTLIDGSVRGSLEKMRKALAAS